MPENTLLCAALYSIVRVSHLCTENLQSLLNIHEGLLTSRGSWSAENQLSRQFPVLGDVPSLSDLLIDQRVVVLKVRAESLLLKSSPDRVLVHSVGMRSPDWELVSVKGEFLLHGGDSGAVDEEEDL